MRFFKQKKFVVPFLVMMMLCSGLCGALAAVVATDTINSTATIIVDETYAISLWKSSTHTTELTDINWGTLEKGASTTQTIWVWNGGNVAAYLTLTSDLSSDIGIVSAAPKTLGAGGCGSMLVTLTISENATVTNPSFVITVQNNDA